MRSMPCVLSIGLKNVLHIVAYNQLLEDNNCLLAAVDDYGSLCRTDLSEYCDVAVLHGTLLPRELQETARLVRRQWPKARILIIRSEASCIDDVLYDERISPEATPDALLMAIRQLVHVNVAKQPKKEGQKAPSFQQRN